MAVKRISPDEAREIIDKQGYAYLDVRSVPEFEAGHPTGAYNVPLLHMGPGGMSPNPDFMAVVQKAFPTDARLVLGGLGYPAAGLPADRCHHLDDADADWRGSRWQRAAAGLPLTDRIHP